MGRHRTLAMKMHGRYVIHCFLVTVFLKHDMQAKRKRTSPGQREAESKAQNAATTATLQKPTDVAKEVERTFEQRDPNARRAAISEWCKGKMKAEEEVLGDDVDQRRLATDPSGQSSMASSGAVDAS